MVIRRAGESRPNAKSHPLAQLQTGADNCGVPNRIASFLAHFDFLYMIRGIGESMYIHHQFRPRYHSIAQVRERNISIGNFPIAHRKRAYFFEPPLLKSDRETFSFCSASSFATHTNRRSVSESISGSWKTTEEVDIYGNEQFQHDLPRRGWVVGV